MSTVPNGLRLKYFAKMESKAIFFLLCLFPYVTFGLIAADNSPFYLLGCIGLIGIFFLYNLEVALRRDILLSLVISLLILIVEIVRPDPVVELMKFVASFYLILVLVSIPRLLQLTNLDRLVFVLSVIWVSATILTFVKPGVFSFLLYRTATDMSRGATGLSTEPANWGQASAFMIILAERVIKKRRLRNLAIGFFGFSCLLSLSLFGLVYLALVVWFLIGFKRTFFLGLAGFTVLVLLLPETSRLYFLLSKLLTPEGFYYLFVFDHSIAYRIMSFFTIPKLFLDGAFLGQIASGIPSELFRKEGYNLSGINPIVFRYGIIGLFFALVFLRIIYRFVFQALRDRPWQDNIPVFFILVLMTFVGPIAFPYFYLALSIGQIARANHEVQSSGSVIKED